jgi:SSS family solute:Na+ symporter
VTAGMVAAFMSTHDSYLLCWSGVITQDVVAPLVKKELTQKQRILITRVAIVATGIMLLIWGLWYEVSSNLWQYMAITGTVYLAGVFPVVIGGLYWPRSSSVGAYIALLGGLTGILGLDPCIKLLNASLADYGLAFEFHSSLLMLLTFEFSFIGFVAGSLLFPDAQLPDSQPATREGVDE